MLLPPTQGAKPHPCSQTRGSGRPGHLLLCMLGGRREKHVPWKHRFKLGGRDSGLVASPLINTLNQQRQRPHTASWVDGGGEGRTMSNTRSLGVLIWGIASTLAFQRAAPPIALPSCPHGHKQPQAMPLSQQPRPSEIFTALLVPVWALSMAQAKRCEGRAIKQCLPSVLDDSGSREMRWHLTPQMPQPAPPRPS